MGVHPSESSARRSAALWAAGDHHAACDAAIQAATLAGSRVDLLGRAGTLCLKLGRLEQAGALFSRVVHLDAGWSVGHHLLGITRMRQGRPDLAVPAFQHAVALEPATPAVHTSLADALLAVGRLREGWAEWTWRFGAPVPPAHPAHAAPIWDGSPLEGRVLMLWLEQGLGDQIQFVRFVRQLRGRVWLQAPKKLHSLFSALPIERLVDAGEPVAGFDAQLPLLSLPGVLGIGLEDLDGQPYLRAPDSAPLPLTTDRLRVGLVWASKPTHPSAHLRDCPLPLLAELATVPGIQLYGLQFGAAAAALHAHPKIIDLSDSLGDFGQTAAVVEQMDLVITVDTAMAHLAGSLGKPVFTMIGTQPDWRWMQHRSDSPWYSTMRLFRNTGGWPAALAEVRAALEARCR